jgi:peptidoglycan/xylan/chitin deacetylase (PgdA/CDA1 family)
MSASATVIVYHAIGSYPRGAEQDALYVGTDAFAAQLAFLARHRRVVPLEQIVSGVADAGAPAVAITFDDGFRSVLTEAVPVLEEHGFPATAFVTTRWIEADGSAGESAQELLDAVGIEELARRGIEIGSHGHTHAEVGRLGAATIEADLRTSRERIEEITGAEPRYLAWPYGRTSAAGIEAARAAGFEAAFTTDLPTSGTYTITRVPIYRPDGRTLFSLKTSGRYVGLRRHSVVGGAYSVVEPVVSRLRR